MSVKIITREDIPEKDWLYKGEGDLSSGDGILVIHPSKIEVAKKVLGDNFLDVEDGLPGSSLEELS